MRILESTIAIALIVVSRLRIATPFHIMSTHSATSKPNAALSSSLSSSSSGPQTVTPEITQSLNFKNVRAVIFDIDGTLAESGNLGFEATNVVLRNNNVPTITKEQYLVGCRYTTPVRLAWHCGLSEEKNSEEFRIVGTRLGDEFDNYYINLVSIETAPFYSGMYDLIGNLPSTVKLGALTNAAGRYAHAVLTVNSNEAASVHASTFYQPDDLYNRFESIYGADEVPRPKPFADGLFLVCKQLNVSPCDCVYIGDASSDGMAAKAAGMAAVGVTWGANTEDTLVASNVFDSICRTVNDLVQILPQK